MTPKIIEVEKKAKVLTRHLYLFFCIPNFLSLSLSVSRTHAEIEATNVAKYLFLKET